METKYTNNFSVNILIALIFINAIIFLSNDLFNYYNTSFSLIGNLLIVIYLVMLQGKFNKLDNQILIFIIFFIAYSLFTILFNNGGIGSAITPIYGFLVYFLIIRNEISSSKLKILLAILLSINLYMVLNSNGYYLKFFYNRTEYINSNIIANLIMYTSIYSSILLRMIKIKFSKIVITLIYILSAYGILNCQSRGSLVTLLSFIILDGFISKKIWRNRKITLCFFAIIVFMGLLVPYIYTFLYNNGIEFEIPFTSKTLYSGREDIWNNFFYTMNEDIKNLVFGLGSEADLWTGNDLNLHNNYLGVITNFGIIGFLLYYVFWFSQIRVFFQQSNIENHQISLLLGFFVVLINGFYEISTLWHVMFFYNYLFLGLAIEKSKLKHS